LQEPLGLRPALEAHHKIVGVADDYNVPLRHFLAPRFHPQVENLARVSGLFSHDTIVLDTSMS
jgi:hypothetical protein